MNKFLTQTLAIATIAVSGNTFATPIQLTTHLAKPEAFGVTSTIIEGEKDAILINAQFTRAEALRVAAQILDGGKNLKTIFVSYGDPDFYFGLETLKTIFPNAEIVATSKTLQHIEATHQLKLQYWGPQMGLNAPSTTVLPNVVETNHLVLEQDKIEIKGKDNLTYLWIPSIKAVIGGIPVTSGTHLWMADTPTTQDREKVIKVLEEIKALKPNIVIPAHMIANADQGLKAVQFSIDYLNQYEKATKSSKTSEELVKTMKSIYPDLSGTDSLELGAKVVKGELQWP